ncbi:MULTISPECIES: DNA-processing protein DprA [Pseudobutyrivibrio]|uniref:DNA processing protein n=1 Tax=Pseudobutyrivibrio xylanivorans TaxID=185007 RepID=A0A1G5RYU4_PSEXY|nr:MULTISPECIES: DNA-processing protein DprA [Pseudobutyrivibrio]MDC7278188.1 DNA-processing protein DprA [Butyrivibrio fibrisolvens]SCZ78489.1 DNA processing protein [Pseudobutyrivibrio xylanivorans]
MNEIVYQHWFLSNEDIAFTRKSKLIDYFYDSYHIYHATKKELLDSNLLDEKEADVFISNREKYDLAGEYEEFTHTPFSFITIEDKKYPEKLKNIYEPPYGLFYVGKLPDFERCVSIVGARRCSAYGKKVAQDLGEALGNAGYTVISGMARGIDSYGHRGCLAAGGNTVAVLGCGCDVVYPSENRLLYEEIAKNGAILSEYQIGSCPKAWNFPLRNRIVSALSDVVIVVEAREKSGSLITADFALEQGKDIYVVPGRIGDSLSEGCNKLITQGAGVICNVNQFINELAEAYGQPVKKHTSRKSEGIKLDKNLSKIYNMFDLYPKSLATVLEESGMDYLQLLSAVLTLERMGLLSEAFKNNYIKQL